jgi:hypothetical protein
MMQTMAFVLFKNKKLKSKQENCGGVSFGLPDVLCSLGGILSRVCVGACSVHCTCAAFRNRHNFCSAFFATFWGFSHFTIRL